MSSIIDGFALGSDRFVQEELVKFLNNKKIAKGQGEIFSTLTAPIDASFINQAEISLLKIALNVEKGRKLKKEFVKNSAKKIISILNEYPKTKKFLEKHQKNYFWSNNNYFLNKTLTVEDFIGQIKEMFRYKVDIKAEIKRILDTPKQNKIKKQKLSQRLSLPVFLRNLLEISETFTHFQDERKKYTFWATHYSSIILQEIGKRFGYTLTEMKYLLNCEVIDLFDKNKQHVTCARARDRRKYCILYHRGKEYEILTGNQARKFQHVLFNKEIKKDINDFRGLSASNGKVKGSVKILKSATEVNKIEKGDILVAVMTRPDYISAMKRASAIVTNEGGITCHAAIVSRELGIPCIIGTKIATDILNDGDLVEVNANHGVVKILKRK
ncbi:hypothetical protein C4569_03400 [Candidatus Parcubacteria bacterium]|nr:MAG: hypothetical protein C4569_03400 [Candidatus Parcubacteria bacterium]